ncbi:condensin subunit Cnd3 [Coprinopsis cinerea AmutBmut pab1-1]|nr:condensin subunit Cnd3 [Coprinopsis cinerea AmutBmut pab1-1]
MVLVFIDKPTDARLKAVCSAIPDILHEIQGSVANHCKNSVALYKVHRDAQRHVMKGHRSKPDRVGQRVFCDAFLIAFSRTLKVTAEQKCAADNVLKFLVTYIKYLKKQDENGIENVNPEDEDQACLTERRPIEPRFTKSVLAFLMDGFEAKDKSVRFRVVHTLSELLHSKVTLGDDDLRARLERTLLRDSDSQIRARAGLCLALLYSLDGCVREGVQETLEELYEVMQFDDKPEVRKAILCNLPVDRTTLDHILPHLRDREQTIRKAIYTQVLTPQVSPKDGSPAYCHPSSIKPSQRLAALAGLDDREDGVQKAAEEFIDAWLNAPEPENGQEAAQYDALERLVCLLKFFRVQKREEKELRLVCLMVKTVLKNNSDICDNIGFQDLAYWREDAVPEEALLIRSVAQYFLDAKRDNKLDGRLEEMLPTVAEMAQIIAVRCGVLLQAAEQDDKLSARFILIQLLELAVHLDYSDYVGTNVMRQCMKTMIVHPKLPEELFDPCLDVLVALVQSESDFIQTVVELVHDILDASESDEESVETQDPESSAPQDPDSSAGSADDKAKRRLRCLRLCRTMLERVEMPVERYSLLKAIIEDLIYPVVKTTESSLAEGTDHKAPEDSASAALYEVGVRSLCLASLVCESLAPVVFDRATRTICDDKVPLEVKLIYLQAIFDLVVKYKHLLDSDGKGILVKMNKSQQLEVTITMRFTPHSPVYVVLEEKISVNTHEGRHPETLATICQGLAKLLHGGILDSPDALRELYKTLILPETAGNHALRQCLDHFFEEYSTSHPKNQMRMQEIFKSVFVDLVQRRKEDDPVTLPILCNKFVHYTSYLNLKRNVSNDPEAQFRLIESMLIIILKEPSLQKGHRKDLFRSLSDNWSAPSNLPEFNSDDSFATSSTILVFGIKFLIDKVKACRPPRDSHPSKWFGLFETAFTTRYQTLLEPMSDDEFRELEQLERIFEEVKDIFPDDEDVVAEPRTRGQKRRSLNSMAKGNDCEDVKPVIHEINPPKRRRVSTTTDKDEDDEIQIIDPPPRAGGNADDPIVISSDEEDDEPTRQVPRRRLPTPPRSPKVKQEVLDGEEARLDQSMSRLLSPARGDGAEVDDEGETSWDSIMDTTRGPDDSDEEEEEEKIQQSLLDVGED